LASFTQPNPRQASLSTVRGQAVPVPSPAFIEVHDLNGNRTRLVYPGGLTVTNTFDAADRLATVQDWAGRTVTYGYNAAHSPTGMGYPNGVTGALAWDGAQRLTRVSYTTNGAVFVDRVYTLDAAGNRVQEDVNAGLLPTLAPSMRRFAQDPADRITSIAEKTHPDSPAWANSAPVWDPNGNMLTDGSGLTLAYDIENRATNLQSAVLGTRAFFYNGSGAVVKRTVNGANYVDVLDGNRLLMTRTTNGTVLVYYVWGNGLIARVGTNGVALYAHADGQGNVLALTATNGAVTDQWFYSPYGQVLNRTGSTDTPFQWLGAHGVRHEGGGIYLTRYRVYHAGLMRFTSADPIGLAGGANLFAYCLGNPLVLIDPDGKCGTQNRIEFNMPGYGSAQSYQIVGGNVRNLTVSDAQVGSRIAHAAYGLGTVGDMETVLSDASLGWKVAAGVSIAADLAGFGQAIPSTKVLRAAKSPAGLLTSGTRTPNAGGVIRSFAQESDQVYYRVFSENAQGRFLTATPPRSSAWAREALALPEGNQATYLQEVLVPAGTRLQRSRALPAFGRQGGAEQFELLEQIPNGNFGAGSAFP
jgi:RHS repeat-associated protein